jgi:predicted transcriptional regulator
MAKLSQLPDAEFRIMQVIWNNPAPITSAQVDMNLKESKAWHVSTVKTLLRRLVDRGYLSAEKNGKEFFYTFLVSQDEYLHAETEFFMEKFHKKSLRGLMRAMYAGRKPSDEDIAEIEEWFNDEVK